MSVRIPVHIHVSRNNCEQENTTHYTITPVGAFAHPHAPLSNGKLIYPRNYSRSESELLGYIVAPDGTEAFTAWGGIDVVRLRGDAVGTELSCAMDYAKHKWDGLAWEPAASHA